GIKFCLSGARPVGEDSGLAEIRRRVEEPEPAPSPSQGKIESRDLLGPYTDHVLSFVDASAMRPLTIVADTANGMGGLVVPAVFQRLPFELVHLFPDLDGTFPNHPADPINPENQRDLKKAVLENSAAVGLAFAG